MTMVWEKLDMSSYCQVSFWYDVHSIELCELAGERQWLNKLVLNVIVNDGLRNRDFWDIDAVTDNFHSIGLCERRWLGGTSLSVTDTMLWSQDCKFHFLSLQNKTSPSLWSFVQFRSDSNSYFPIGPCEYGGPIQALMAGDANAGGQ